MPESAETFTKFCGDNGPTGQKVIHGSEMVIVGPVMTPDAAPPTNHVVDAELGGLGQFLDLERYPLTDLGSATGRQVVDAARAQLAATGAAELAGVVNAAGIQALVEDAEELAVRAHHSEGEGTAYLEFPDFDLPKEHPRLRFAPYGLSAVGYDIIPRTSLLRKLYESDALLGFIAAILDRGPLYRYGDPLAPSTCRSWEKGTSCSGISTRPISWSPWPSSRPRPAGTSRSHPGSEAAETSAIPR